jgi:hypothetical protein
MDPDGSNQVQLTSNAADEYEPVWSPDRAKIAFIRQDCSTLPCEDLYIMNADGTGQTFVDNGWSHPDWQPLGGLDRYPRPGGGTPLRVPLVHAFRVCGSASNPQDSNHVAPLALDSCDPPIQASELLTTSTPGAMNAFARLDVQVGNPSTPADEADVRVTMRANDVQTTAGADYNGPVILATRIRLTDMASGFGGVSATVEDTDLSLPVTCAVTPLTVLGSVCDLSTTLDTVVPGLVPEGKRSIISAFTVRVRDAGPDGDIGSSATGCPPTCGTGDERTFLDQGIFLP